MSFKLELGYKQRLEQCLVLPMRVFEQQLWEKIEFIGIDSSYDTYHSEMLDALLTHYECEEMLLIAQIVLYESLENLPIEKIIVKSFESRDISMEIGTKRNVDIFTLQFKDYADIVMTVSLDKNPVRHKQNSPSLQETTTLGKIQNPELAWSVQRWFGSTYIEDDEGI